MSPSAGLAPELDCLIIGGGPAGLTAGLYFARFNRRFAIIDSGQSRAGSIPNSHNLSLFAEGIPGGEILARQREHLSQYGASPIPGEVTRLEARENGFEVEIESGGALFGRHFARHVLLATGVADTPPALPDPAEAVREGLLRYCPICDGFDAQGKSVAVLGRGAQGLGEAVFLARTYTRKVTLLSISEDLVLPGTDQSRAAEHGIKVVREPIVRVREGGRGIEAIGCTGTRFEFDLLYSALGLRVNSGLARALGAEADETGALIVDAHNQTSVPGLFAAGDVVSALNQIVVAMAHAAIAATAIHNRCQPATQDEQKG